MAIWGVFLAVSLIPPKEENHFSFKLVLSAGVFISVLSSDFAIGKDGSQLLDADASSVLKIPASKSHLGIGMMGRRASRLRGLHSFVSGRASPFSAFESFDGGSSRSCFGRFFFFFFFRGTVSGSDESLKI